MRKATLEAWDVTGESAKTWRTTTVFGEVVEWCRNAIERNEIPRVFAYDMSGTELAELQRIGALPDLG